MESGQILPMVWAFLNSSFGITVVLAVLAWTLNAAYAKVPTLAKYEGSFIAAVKYAEKQIPDGTPNQGLARLDTALKYVVKIIEARENRQLSQPELAEVAEKIQVVHADVEAKGGI